MEFLTQEDICELLQVKSSKAYAIIRDLNAELARKGFMTARGRVPKQYFYERFALHADKAKKGGQAI